MSWPARITTELAELKRAGNLDFAEAWARAVQAHPAPRSAYGPEHPCLDDLGEECMFEFVERTSRAAWDGESIKLDRSLLEDAHAGFMRHPNGAGARAKNAA